MALFLFLAISAMSPSSAADDAALTLVAGLGGSERVELSLEDLAAIPRTVIVTENEFTNGPVAYGGPLMRQVLHQAIAAGATGDVRLTAANDYFVDIPIRDFIDYDVILAMDADGKPLSRREKGPLWLMYPISGNASLQDPLYIHRLIWQVVRIELP